MTNLLKSYSLAFRYLFKDSTNFLLAIIPVGLGISIYALIGKWIFGTALSSGQQWIETHIASQNWGGVIYWIAITLLSILLFMVVNWTFVLVVSLIASPFNDLLSRRVDAQYRGLEVKKLNRLLQELGGNILKILWNEIKKIFLILLFVILSFALSIVPILVPISTLLSALILAAGYLDYSWSRYELPAGKCFASIKAGWVSYGISGFGYMLLLSIPLINLFSIPFAVIQYTILFIDKSPDLLEGELAIE